MGKWTLQEAQIWNKKSGVILIFEKIVYLLRKLEHVSSMFMLHESDL